MAIENAYAEFATAPSILPQRDEEWVFSIIEVDSYDSSGRTFKAHDFFGHTLAFRLDFGGSCINVVYAKLDCVDVPLSTQTYATAQLNSCGWTSESSWTIP